MTMTEIVRKDPPAIPGEKPECSVIGCHQGSETRGKCKPHYNRWLKTGVTGGAEPGEWWAS